MSENIAYCSSLRVLQDRKDCEVCKKGKSYSYKCGRCKREPCKKCYKSVWIDDFCFHLCKECYNNEKVRRLIDNYEESKEDLLKEIDSINKK